MSDTQPQTVLVTGGSGYIAAFVIDRLLREGYAVRATIRSLAKEAELRKTLAKLLPENPNLSFVAADLNGDAGWAEAAAGCAYVQHLASPLPTSNPKNDESFAMSL